MVFKYWSLGLFIGLIWISPMYADTDGIHIEYEGEVPSKVTYTSSGVTKIIPHVALTDLLTDDEKKIFKDFEQNLHDWKWYMRIQSLCVALAGYLTIQNYIDGDIAYKLRNTKLACLIANTYRYVPELQWGAMLGVGVSTIYPFYRFCNLFIGYLEDTYLTWAKDDKIFVIHRKTYSHSEVHGTLIFDYFNYSEPLGYILLDEKDEFFKQVHQAQSALKATIMAQTAALGALGSWWVLSSI